jgi:integrase
VRQSLLEYALTHSHGQEGLLFGSWTNVRRDLHRACEAVEIRHCSPNDLRWTCATWLRAAGASPELIAPVMGHADTRMVERVYGRLPVEDLRRRLAQAMGLDCITGVSNPVEMGGFGARFGPAGRSAAFTVRDLSGNFAGQKKQ